MIPLQYDITVVGADKVKAALRSVEQGVKAHNQRVQAEVNRSTQARIKGAQSEERAAKERVKTEEKAARERARAAAAEDRAQARARTNAQRAKRDLAASASAAQSRALLEERSANRMAEIRKRTEVMARHADERRRRAQDDLARSRRVASLRDEMHAIRADDDAKRRKRQLAAAEEKATLRQRLLREKIQAATEDRVNRVKGIVGGATRTARGVAGAAAGTVAVAGGALLASGIATEVEERAQASKLANQAGDPSMKGRILDTARGVRGFTGAEAMAGLGSFMDLTGDAQTGLAILNELGAVALATSTDLGELGAAAGNAFIPLNDAIKDPTERLAAMQGVIRSMAGMGAVGAVEIKDLAAEMAGLAAQATKFKGGPQKAMTTALAMAQAARQRGGASSAAEAVTSVERFGSDILTKQGDLRAMGVEVFTDKSRTQMRSQEDIMQDVLAKTGGDLGKLGGVFGERSIRAIQGFSPLYVAAEKQAEAARKAGDPNAPKKGEAGRAAVAAEFQRLQTATLSDKQVRERADSRMQDADMQYKEAMKQFNAAVGRDLLPALTALVPELTKLAPVVGQAASALASFVGWASRHPWAGIGAVMAAAVGKDIISAGIGATINALLARLLGQQAAAAAASTAASGGAAAAGGAAAKGAGAAAGAGGLALGAAGAAAAVGIVAAGYQASQLARETTGREWGMTDYVNPLAWGEALGAGFAADAVAQRDVESQNLQQAKQELYRMQGLDAFGNPRDPVDMSQVGGAQVPAMGSAPAPTVVPAGGQPGGAVGGLDTSKLDQSAESLNRAGQAIERAVSGGLNRGNSPSPVKG